MPRVAILMAVLCTYCLTVSAQDRVPYLCPTLSVETSGLKVRTGETVKFTAKVDPLGQELKIEYKWHLSYGKILSGQGTPTIEVEKTPSGTLTATVNIKGTPDDSHCPLSHSETVTWDGPAEAEKITSIPGASLDAAAVEVNRAVSVLSQFPSDHLYIFLGHRRDASEEEIFRREADLVRRLPADLEKARYSIAKTGGTSDVTEFWRVPPGADNPVCRECSSSQCPAISVIGPAGITQPGEPFTFTGTVEGKVPENVRYEWTVTGGKIVAGQGTLKVAVDADWSLGGATVTVTLNIAGLGEGCRNSATESAGVSGPHSPILIDEFSRLANDAFRKRIDKLFAELESHPTHQGYIILYGTDREMSARERLVTRRINFRRFDRPRITIVRGGLYPEGKVYIKLYRIPPGAENPAP